MPTEVRVTSRFSVQALLDIDNADLGCFYLISCFVYR